MQLKLNRDPSSVNSTQWTDFPSANYATPHRVCTGVGRKKFMDLLRAFKNQFPYFYGPNKAKK